MNAKRPPSLSGNRMLSSAKAAKQDEFYTQLADIANELKHYKEHLRGGRPERADKVIAKAAGLVRGRGRYPAL